MARSGALLLVGCSRRKRNDPGLLPALERYDGVNFRVLRKAIREGRLPPSVRVLILSARYGLIEPGTPVEDYDERMTVKRALSLQQEVSAVLDRYLRGAASQEVFVNLGKAYVLAVSQSKELQKRQVTYATGGIGRRMAQMRAWIDRVGGQLP